MSEPTALTGLLPLIPPPAPPEPWWQVGWPVLLIILGLSAFAIWWCSTGQRVRRELARLARRAANPNNGRDVAADLDHWLRRHLGRSRLDTHPPKGLPVEPWQRLVSDLAVARFADQVPSTQQLLTMIAAARALVQGEHD